jgi:quercetin dioxygenase-like cupin family protein
MPTTATLVTISLLTGVAVAILAQTTTQPTVTSKVLIREPLGDTADAKVSVLGVSIPPGGALPTHTDQGPIFAYILQGEIENQVDPDPPKAYHPGDFFYAPGMHVHRMLRNLSPTETTKLLAFQVGDTGKAKALMQVPVGVANREGVLTWLTLAPGAVLHGVHKHPGPVFAYIVKGEIENQVDPEQPMVYRAGDVFYEPPLHAHRMLQNRSQTEPVELAVFQVTEKGQPLAVSVEK